MDTSIAALFQFTRSRVTDQDIIEFSPRDPGYPEYVKLWRRIRQTGDIPRRTTFDLSEVIGLTGWADPTEESNSDRFRHYRRFTSAVGIALLHYDNHSESVRPANYLARDLIIDLDPTDSEHLSLLREVFPVTRTRLVEAGDEPEFPFFTFGEMILAQIARDYGASDSAASRLVEDEATVRSDESLNYLVQDNRFLLGLTIYDQLHVDWLKLADELVNPNDHEDTNYVIDVLARILHE